jgi:hypothetical protein
VEVSDYLVIGSGCCGAIVAKTLIDKGIKVTLLDAGIRSESKKIITETFIKAREEKEIQAETLLGSNFEAFTQFQKKNPLHLTPNRHFVTEHVETFLKWQGSDFNPIESLAKGGLGNAWGLGSYVYSQEELELTGLPKAPLQNAYRWLSQFIGISGGMDESAIYANGNLFQPQTAIPFDFNGARLWGKLQKKSNQLQQQGFFIGRAPLAISTDDSKNGEAYKKDDWDFYNTGITSAFRPINLIEQLQKMGNLNYIPHQLVLKFKQTQNYTEVEALDIRTHERKTFFCKKLILAGGALSTARIVMRSFQLEQLPLLCNPYTYIPSLQFPLLGHANTGYQTGLAQLSLYYDKDRTHSSVAMGSLYSYRSLMAFRLMREFPLDMKGGREFAKLIQPALNITGIFHPEFYGEEKYMTLVKDSTSPSGNVMESKYQLSQEEENRLLQTEKAYRSALRQLGTVPLKTQRNKHGASIHYGGTLPFNRSGESYPKHTSDGRLTEFKNVFIADGSGFQFLSGKGLTLTLMAYAHHVANQSLETQ